MLQIDHYAPHHVRKGMRFFAPVVLFSPPFAWLRERSRAKAFVMHHVFDPATFWNSPAQRRDALEEGANRSS